MELRKEWTDYLMFIGLGESHLPYIEKALDVMYFGYCKETSDGEDRRYISLEDAIRICGYKENLFGVCKRTFSGYAYFTTTPDDGILSVCRASEDFDSVFSEQELKYLRFDGKRFDRIVLGRIF